MKKINIKDLTEKSLRVFADDMLRVLYYEFEAGEKMPNHSHNGLAIIQIIEGKIDVKFDTGESFELVKDDLLQFNAAIVHNIEALDKTRMFITLASYSN